MTYSPSHWQRVGEETRRMVAEVPLYRDRPAPPADAPPPMASATARLESVLHPSDQTIDELAAVIRGEPNPNVRLAAIDVLAERHGRVGLEGRLGVALAHETDPLVRLTMIRKIGEFRLRDDARPLRGLLEQPDLDPIERREADRVLRELAL